MITLNDGREMPALGMGTYRIPDVQAAMIVREGIDLGFKLVDTAAIYGNEMGVGEGVRETGTTATATRKPRSTRASRCWGRTRSTCT